MLSVLSINKLMLGHGLLSAIILGPDLDATNSNFGALQYAFDIELKTPKFSITGNFDPRRGGNERFKWTSYIPPEYSSPAKRFKEKWEKSPQKAFYCSSLENTISDLESSDSTISNTTASNFSPVANSHETEAYLKHMVGYVLRDTKTQEILSYRLENKKPFKPSPFLKIVSHRIEYQCDSTIEGRTYISRSIRYSSGYAAFHSFEKRTLQTISNVQRIQAL